MKWLGIDIEKQMSSWEITRRRVLAEDHLACELAAFIKDHGPRPTPAEARLYAKDPLAVHLKNPDLLLAVFSWARLSGFELRMQDFNMRHVEAVALEMAAQRESGLRPGVAGTEKKD